MNQRITDTNLSILELPSILTHLFERAHRPLLPGAQGPLGLFVRYLRRKPGRGLAVIYSVDEIRRAGRKTHTNDPNRAVSLTLDEQALEGAHIRFSAAQAEQEERERRRGEAAHTRETTAFRHRALERAIVDLTSGPFPDTTLRAAIPPVIAGGTRRRQPSHSRIGMARRA